jgi:large subunit ribosomal protein L6
MSRIGRRSLTIPAGVTLSIQDNIIVVKGPKGELKEQMQPGINIVVDGTTIHVSRDNDLQQTRAHHGLVRSLIANMLKGVSEA